MHWGRDAKQHRAVLDALSTVGEAGLTALALAVMTDLPESRLEAILEELTAAGLIARRLDPQVAVARVRRSSYQIAGRTRGFTGRLGRGPAR